MVSLLTILHVIVCLFLMLTVLLQSGKGGGMGALGGGGGTSTVFGGGGASTFLRSLTAAAATIFMLASMTLAYIASHNAGDPLDKFGASQDDIREQKDKEKDRALAPGSLGSAFAPKGGMTDGSASTIAPPQGATMGVPDQANGSDAAQPTTGTTPILGSGYEPGPATAPVPTGAGAATVAPPKTGSTNSPTTTSTATSPAATVESQAPKAAPAPKVVTPKAEAPKVEKTETPKAEKTEAPKAEKSDAPSPSPGAVTPTPASGSAQ